MENLAEAVCRQATSPGFDDGGFDDGGFEGGISKRWEPVDLADVDWILGKVAVARAEIALVQAQAQKIVDRREQEIASIMERYAEPVKAIVVREVAKNRSGRFCDLLHGRVGLRKKPGRLSVSDKPMALAWAKINFPDVVVTVTEEKLDAAALLGRAARGEGGAVDSITGELMPFVEATQDQDTLYMDTGKTEKVML